MKRKKELIVILSSLLVIVLSVSVAYFTTKILGTGKEISVESADLKVIFTSGSGTINGTNIEPGWTSGESTFTVKNESNGTYNYNIVIKDLVNTFTTSGFLVYKITSSDGGYNMTEFADVPKSSSSKDTTLAYNISIDKDATHTYTVEFKYLKSAEVDQSADMGKTLTGKIFIEESKEFKSGTLSEAMMFNNPTIIERNDISITTGDTPHTLYKTTENDKSVYYFSGTEIDWPINNWVKFGTYEKDSSIFGCAYDDPNDTESLCYVGTEYKTLEECEADTSVDRCDYLWKAGDSIYWRILRTNFDGSIKLLYSGSSPNTTRGFIGISDFDTSCTGNVCEGYMNGRAETFNKLDSDIKAYIDKWYENNFNAYTNYLSGDAIYCNDRELASGEATSSSSYRFKSWDRIIDKPTYNCPNSKDAFSVNNEEAKLKYPIALSTADELVLAGGIYRGGENAWYNKNSLNESIIKEDYWYTMTPLSRERGITLIASVHIDSLEREESSLDYIKVRPVTSLKSCVTWKSGDGSANAPYEIEMNGGC